jgi:hypothetical protein
MKPENRFIAAVNRHLPLKKLRSHASVRARYPEVKHIYYEKMNNGFRGGTWDAWYSGRGGDLWVEFKYLARLPQRASVKPFELLSPLQLDWGHERLNEGRNVAVIVGCPAGGVLLRNRAWMLELPPEQFHERVRSRDDLAAWIMGQLLE